MILEITQVRGIEFHPSRLSLEMCQRENKRDSEIEVDKWWWRERGNRRREEVWKTGQDGERDIHRFEKQSEKFGLRYVEKNEEVGKVWYQISSLSFLAVQCFRNNLDSILFCHFLQTSPPSPSP